MSYFINTFVWVVLIGGLAYLYFKFPPGSAKELREKLEGDIKQPVAPPSLPRSNKYGPANWRGTRLKAYDCLLNMKCMVSIGYRQVVYYIRQQNHDYLICIADVGHADGNLYNQIGDPADDPEEAILRAEKLIEKRTRASARAEFTYTVFY